MDNSQREVLVLSATRTAIGKYGGGLAAVPPSDLAATVFPDGGTDAGENKNLVRGVHRRIPHMSRPPLMAQIWPVM